MLIQSQKRGGALSHHTKLSSMRTHPEKNRSQNPWQAVISFQQNTSCHMASQFELNGCRDARHSQQSQTRRASGVPRRLTLFLLVLNPSSGIPSCAHYRTRKCHLHLRSMKLTLSDINQRARLPESPEPHLYGLGYKTCSSALSEAEAAHTLLSPQPLHILLHPHPGQCPHLKSASVLHA